MFRYRLREKDDRIDGRNAMWLSTVIPACTIDATLTHVVATVPGMLSDEIRTRLIKEWPGTAANSPVVKYSTLSNATTVSISKSAHVNWAIVVLDACIVLLLVFKFSLSIHLRMKQPLSP